MKAIEVKPPEIPKINYLEFYKQPCHWCEKEKPLESFFVVAFRTNKHSCTLKDARKFNFCEACYDELLAVFIDPDQ